MVHEFEEMFGEVNDSPAFIFNAAFPIVLQTLVQSSIPSGLLGLIHLGSEFTIHKLHNWLLPTDLEVVLEEADDTLKGIKYQITTRAYQFGRLTIENQNWMLEKNKFHKSKSVARRKTDWTELTSFGLDISQARQYAKASLDYNPIHMSNQLARLFGLPKALIHGMYNVHMTVKALSEFEQLLKINKLSIEFNKPCYLPNKVSIRIANELNHSIHNSIVGNDIRCGLFSNDGTQRFLKLEAQKKEA